METLPELQLSEKHPQESVTGTEMSVSDILLNVLSRLTVYQSLPETGSLVLAVRDDVSMLDACCLFLPSASSPTSLTSQVIEILESPVFGHSSGDSPESKSKRLFNLSNEFPKDSFFSKALRKESIRVTSAIAQDPNERNPIGNFLSVYDFFYFINSLISGGSVKVDETTTVANWLRIKTEFAVSGIPSPWRAFCERSMLVKRSCLNLSQGIDTNQVVSGSSMNMSSSNLQGFEEEGSSHCRRFPKSGGCTLVAVSELFERPWQTTLPLTVSTEKGVSAIFAYTSLQQLIAHAAMNCADPILEPFFNSPIEYSELQKMVHKEDLETAILSQSSLVEDAVKVLAINPVAIVVNAEKKFVSILRPDDIFELISSRMDPKKNSSDSESLLAFSKLPLPLSPEESESFSTICSDDFPMNLSLLLQRLLLARGCCLVVLSNEHVPVGTLTVRDMWSLVMDGASLVSTT